MLGRCLGARDSTQDVGVMSEDLVTVPRGRSKSGRIWRDPGFRSKSVIASSGPKLSWNQRKSERAITKAMKELEREMKGEALKNREERKKKLTEKRRKKLENEKKAEVVQKITNVSKLKRLKKKQMRNIEKR